MHDRREQDVGHALERADVDAADLAGEEAADGVARRVDAGDDVAGVAEHELAERRQFDGARSTGTVEQGPADEPLEGGDLLADSRLRVAEPDRRTAERALRRHCIERRKVAQFEVAKLLHVHQCS